MPLNFVRGEVIFLRDNRLAALRQKPMYQGLTPSHKWEI
jgi:hypothetical protein